MTKLIFAFTLIQLLIFAPMAGKAQTVQTGSQINIDYNSPREFTIGGISVSGVNYMDHNIIVMISQLNVGDRILVPGEDIARAIDNIWKQGLFTDVAIAVTSIQGEMIFLDIELRERPRLTRFEFTGTRRSDENKLTEKLNLVRGDVVTENVLFRARSIIEDYYVEKGFLKPDVSIRQLTDTTRTNSIILEFDVDRGDRTRISEVIVHGNEVLSDRQIKRLMKNTRERSLRFLFNSSKLVEDEFREDKQKIIDRYNELGKRDAVILRDTFYFVEENRIKLELFIDEGPTYYFRTINWVGNTIYPDDFLTEVLGVRPGDIYNQKLLEKNLYMNMDGVSISVHYTLITVTFSSISNLLK
jgi:outer membrane protein insertion porin family